MHSVLFNAAQDAVVPGSTYYFKLAGNAPTSLLFRRNTWCFKLLQSALEALLASVPRSGAGTGAREENSFRIKRSAVIQTLSAAYEPESGVEVAKQKNSWKLSVGIVNT